MFDAEDDVRIRRIRAQMAGLDAQILVLTKTKNLRHTTQKGLFAGVKHAIRHGNAEQPVEQILQHGGLIPKQPGYLFGVSLIARHILTREIKQAPHVFHLGGRHTKHLLEGVDFGAGHLPVRLGHLGGKSNHAHGKDDGGCGTAHGPVARLAASILHALVDHVPRQSAEQRAQRPAEHKAAGCPGQFSPDRHIESTFTQF